MRNRGSLHLARIFGIDLYLHWSWWVVALIEIEMRSGAYTAIGWNVLEYLALFLIVTLHEFGHALACRQTGGTANRIVLWPLGGIAYVDPPPRPGPTLWSLAAGPLVNVALAPILWAAAQASWLLYHPNALLFAHSVEIINLGLLIFNLLPVYPLDGGQILQSLLWFWLGRARSLMIVSVIGFAGVLGLAVIALRPPDLWLLAIDAFILTNCWSGLQRARALWRRSKLPRHAGWACRWCDAAPLVGALWRCPQCQQGFDAFVAGGACPHCAAGIAGVTCPECGRMHPLADWAAPAPTSAPAPAAPASA